MPAAATVSRFSSTPAPRPHVTSTAMPAVATSGILVDNAAPKILSFGLPGSRTYRPGETLLFTAVMSERVTVTGTPAIRRRRAGRSARPRMRSR